MGISSGMQHTLLHSRHGLLFVWHRLVGTVRGILAKIYIRNILASFSLEMVQAGLSFLIGVLLARFLGSKGFGIYCYALAVVMLVALPVSASIKILVVRKVADCSAKEKWGDARRSLRRVVNASLGFLFPVGALMFLGSWYLDEWLGTTTAVITFWAAIPLVLIVPLLQLAEACLRGLNQIIYGKLSSYLLRPLLVLILIACAYYFLRRGFNPSWAMMMQTVGSGCALVFALFLVRKLLPRAVGEASSTFETKAWAKGSALLLFIGFADILNRRVGLLLLGPLWGAGEVGVYAATLRLAELVSFGIWGVNIAIGPLVVRHYRNRELSDLQRLVTNSTRLILLFCLPLALPMILFGRWVLLLFGTEFIKGATPLAVLAVGKLLIATVGTVDHLLNMTHKESITAKAFGISVTFNVLLSIWLIPKFGMTGAAVANAISAAIWCRFLSVSVYRELGLRASVLRGPLAR